MSAPSILGPGAVFGLYALINEWGVVRHKELLELGVRREAIQDAVKCGFLIPVCRGLYTGCNSDPWLSSPFAQVMLRYERPIAALRTALMLHRLIPWNDNEPLCLALGHRDRTPKVDFPVTWLRWKVDRRVVGVEATAFNGVPALITTPARTVADCFAHRARLNPGEPERILQLFRLSDAWDLQALREAAAVTRTTRLIRATMIADGRR